MSHLPIAGAPAGSVGYPSGSGWVTNELFVKWLEHFIGFAKPTVDNKVTLLLDGHASHKTLEVVELCRENGVVLICVPPHTTHQMQPLDKTVYGPMKKNYNEQCDCWMLKNPAQRITMFEQGALFGAAFVKTAGMQKAVNGFEKTVLLTQMYSVMRTSCHVKLQMRHNLCQQETLMNRKISLCLSAQQPLIQMLLLPRMLMIGWY